MIAFPVRPSVEDSHAAIHYVLREYASLVEERVVVGECPIAGVRSRRCRVRVGPERLHVVVTLNHAGNYVLRA